MTGSLFPASPLQSERSRGSGSVEPAWDSPLLEAPSLPGDIRLGTSSWFFPGWRGLVYEGTHAQTTLSRKGLAAYAQIPLLRTVSLDRTFYAPLSSVEYRRYAEQVPEHFSFVVKAPALICDAVLFAWLEAHLDRLLAGDAAALAHVIRRSCEIKAAIVGRDERESGERAVLNLGHTFGHAIEAATGYRRWLHGEAVGAGLVMAAAMSAECALLAVPDSARVRRLVERAGLPTHIAAVSPAAALDHMARDKKVLAGQLRLVLLRRIGEAFMTADFPAAKLERLLAAHFG